jgi:hypothetical protein
VLPRWQRAAASVCLPWLAGLAQALTVNAGDVALLPGNQPIGNLVLNGGTVYLSVNIDRNPKPSLGLFVPVFLQGGSIRSGTMSGNSGLIVRFDLGLNADTLLSGATVLDGGFPGDGEALTTTNRGLMRQIGAGELSFWTLSNFDNLGTFQIENDLGIRYTDVWAPLDHREPYVERFANAGQFSKVAGTGTSLIGMPLDNLGGQVSASSGTLQLDAGGQHLNGSFQGLAGGRIELAGDHAFSGQTIFEGNVNFQAGGSPLTFGVQDVLLIRSAGAGFAGASSARDLVVNAQLTVEASAWFTNFASLRIGGQGRADVAGTLNNLGWLVNEGSLTVQPGGRLAYRGDLVNQFGAHLTNQGSLEANFDGVRWGSLTNHGILYNAAGAGMGTADVTSTVGSTFNNDGYLQHSGRWDLAGGLAIGTGGVLDMGWSSSITTAPGAQLSVAPGGTLNNLGGTLVHAGGQFSVAGGGLLTNGTTSSLAATLWLQGGALALDGTLDNGLRATVIVEPGSQISGRGSISNAGVFLIREQGTVVATSFTQSAGLLSIDGTLDTYGGDVVINGGTLNGGGFIQGNLIAGGAQVNAGDPPKVYPGHSPGHLTVSGSFLLLAGAELQLQVERQADGSLAWDQVTAAEMFFADGSLVHAVLGAGVADASWQTLSFLACGTGCSFSNGVQFVVDGAPGSTLQWSSAGLTLSVAPLQAVPEPSAAAMLLVGLLVAGAVRRAVQPRLGPCDVSSGAMRGPVS